MKKNTNINLNLFNSNLNNNYKSIPFNTRYNDTGEIKYLPPVSKEWTNTIYSYYKNDMKNIPVNNINTNKIIKYYFNLQFKDHNFIDSKFVGLKKRRHLLRRIYASKIETKHTNSKVIITIYTVNIGKPILEKIYEKNLRIINKRILKAWKIKLNNKLKERNLFIKEEKNNFVLSKFKSLDNKKRLFTYKYKLLSESLNWYNLYLKLYLTRAIKFTYYNKLKFLRKYQYNYYLNKFKFDNTKFLPKLNNLLSKIYNKSLEFNIINLKSITLNSDILTEVLALKIRKQNSNILGVLKGVLKRALLPKVNRIVEKGSILKNKNPLLIENKYKNLSLISIMNKDDNSNSLEKILNKTTDYTAKSLVLRNRLNSILNKDYTNISNIIFNSIKYKNMGGLRLEVKGRLTRRYRADRSIFKLNWKGGLKNIDSSYKGLSTVTYRGYYKPNISYSVSNSKRRIGAFAVKGWVSGK